MECLHRVWRLPLEVLAAPRRCGTQSIFAFNTARGQDDRSHNTYYPPPLTRDRRGCHAATVVNGLRTIVSGETSALDRALSAGGGSDFLARTVGAQMEKQMGQPIVIENRPGAATMIGAEAVARGTADGYTLLSGDNGTFVFNTALYKKVPYDPAKDFAPIGLMARFPLDRRRQSLDRLQDDARSASMPLRRSPASCLTHRSAPAVRTISRWS